MLDRDAALALMRQHCPETLWQHALASAAVLGALATHLGEDTALWSVTGLLHDLDYARTAATPEQHGLVAAAQLQGQLPEAALTAIRAHNREMNGAAPAATRLDFALRCGETVTGLVVAAALVRPTGIMGMEVKSLKKKMKDKAFAASVNRANIQQCSELGLTLDEFLRIAIDAMSREAQNLGLPH